MEFIEDCVLHGKEGTYFQAKVNHGYKYEDEEGETSRKNPRKSHVSSSPWPSPPPRPL